MLPKINHPVHTFTQPSANVNLNFRPMTVKEEKILLMARESDNAADTFKAVKQIINNCALSPINIDTMTVADIEWLFLQLRKVSVSNVVPQEYEDNEDGQVYRVNVDLNQVKIPTGKWETQIQVNEDCWIKMRVPNGLDYGVDTPPTTERLVAQCITGVYTKDTATVGPDLVPAEVEEWVQNLPVSVNEEIQKFLADAPELELILEYTNSKGTKREIRLRGLTDFFDLR